MNSLHRYVLLGLVCLAPVPPAKAEPAPSDEAMTLAACRGRYTAVLEHAWLMNDNIEAARMRRDLFAAMLDAQTRPDPNRHQLERQLLSQRITQKQAMSHLLNNARFASDPRRAQHALKLVSQRLATCDRLVVGRAAFGA